MKHPCCRWLLVLLLTATDRCRKNDTAADPSPPHSWFTYGLYYHSACVRGLRAASKQAQQAAPPRLSR